MVITVLCVSRLHSGEAPGLAVEALENAIQVRLEAIGNPPTPMRKREYRRLNKAKALLENYRGLNDKRDIRNLGRASRLVRKALTQDPAVHDATIDLISAIGTFVQSQQDVAENAVHILTSEKYKDSVNQITASGTTALGLGQSFLGTDPLRAQEFFKKA